VPPLLPFFPGRPRRPPPLSPLADSSCHVRNAPNGSSPDLNRIIGCSLLAVFWGFLGARIAFFRSTLFFVEPPQIYPLRLSPIPFDVGFSSLSSSDLCLLLFFSAPGLKAAVTQIPCPLCVALLSTSSFLGRRPGSLKPLPEISLRHSSSNVMSSVSRIAPRVLALSEHLGTAFFPLFPFYEYLHFKPGGSVTFPVPPEFFRTDPIC